MTGITDSGWQAVSKLGPKRCSRRIYANACSVSASQLLPRDLLSEANLRRYRDTEIPLVCRLRGEIGGVAIY
ncbi:MAG: hypothetical protein B7Z55_06810 [Planctomycetales bacterium 12-60-4]|nr:MAG: hypothetical protein B7Z55_06810 [Planctomycetales bacterium 12-60-4]